MPNKINNKNYLYFFINDKVLLIMCLLLITSPQLMVKLFADNFVATVASFFNSLSRARYSLGLILILIARDHDQSQPRLRGAISMQNNSIKLCAIFNIFVIFMGVNFQLK